MNGSELRRIRLRLGLSQKELAARLRIARNSIGRYESDLRPISHVMAMAVRCLAFHQLKARR